MSKEKTSKMSVLFMENDNKYKNLNTSIVFGQCVVLTEKVHGAIVFGNI